MSNDSQRSDALESIASGIKRIGLEDGSSQNATVSGASGGSPESSVSQSIQSSHLDSIPDYETPHNSLMPRPPQLQMFIDKVNSLGNHPERPFILNKISKDSHTKYMQSKSDFDLSWAADLGYLAIKSLNDDDPRLPRFLHDYSRALQRIWERTGTRKSLDMMTTFYKNALHAAREGDGMMPIYLCDVGFALQHKFIETRSIDDLLEARSFFVQSVEQEPHHTSTLAIFRNNIVVSLREEFDAVGRFEALDEAIAIQKDVIESLPDKTPNVQNRTFYRNLGAVYFRKFRKTNAIDDFEEAIANLSKATEVPQSDPDEAILFQDLGREYQLIFYSFDMIADADESIRYYRMAYDIQPDPKDVILICNLAKIICARASRMGYSADDINETINLLRTRLNHNINQINPKDRNMLLNRLGSTVQIKYRGTDSLELLNEIIDYYTRASADEEDSSRTIYLNNLGQAMLFKYERSGNYEDLLRAIDTSSLALMIAEKLGLTSKEHIINNLGNAFMAKFERTYSFDDLETARDYYKFIIPSPRGRREDPLHLNNYANVLQKIFLYVGSLECLHHATNLYEKAFKSTPINRPSRPMYLIGLANSLHLRYQATGSLEDLNRAIIHYNTAVDTTRHDHPVLRSRLYNFGFAKLSRYTEIKVLGDLNDAVKLLQAAVDSILPDNRREVACFNNTLGCAYLRLFESSNDLADLDRAIEHYECAQEAVREQFLASIIDSNLGTSYEFKAGITGLEGDKNKAMQFKTAAVAHTPKDDILRADLLFNLGKEHGKIWKNNGSKEDARMAIRIFEEAFHMPLGNFSTRVSAALMAAELREEFDSSLGDASKILIQAVNLLPEAVTLDLRPSDQMHLMRKYYKLTPYATAMALEADCSADQAMRLFEIGRGVMLNHLLDSRSDLSYLHGKHPDLAERFEYLRSILYPRSANERSPVDTNSPISDEFGVLRKKAAGEFAQVLAEIQALPEHEDFLRPPSSIQLLKLNVEWHIVAINYSRR